MGKSLSVLGLGDVASAIRDVASAVRAHTAHVKIDDERYWEEQNADAKEGGEKPTRVNIFDEAQVATLDAYQRQMGRHYGLPDSAEVIPTHVVELMQETPHQFVRSESSIRYRSTYGNRTSQTKCRICQLKFNNPVHLIQIPTLSYSDHSED